MSHQEDLKKVKNAREEVKLERKLIDAPTSQIVTHLVWRHRVFLLILTNVITLTYVIVRM